MEQASTAAFVGIELLLGAAAVALIRRHDRPPVGQVVRRPDGTQEVRIVVEGRYRPERIDLAIGVPAVLRFDRREDDPCSELLVCELLPNVYRLAPHTETTIRFTPFAPGTYVFTCGLGMYSGWMVVHPDRAS